MYVEVFFYIVKLYRYRFLLVLFLHHPLLGGGSCVNGTVLGALHASIKLGGVAHHPPAPAGSGSGDEDFAGEEFLAGDGGYFFSPAVQAVGHIRFAFLMNSLGSHASSFRV